MNCICGCGTKIGSRRAERRNLLAGEVAVELVVWDKARSMRSPGRHRRHRAMLVAGAPRYQGLLEAIHTDADLGEEADLVDSWLSGSRAER